MNRETLDKIFVSIVFVIILTVMVKNVAITGHVIEAPPALILEKPKLEPGFEDKTYFLELTPELNFHVVSRSGNSIVVKDGEDSYMLQVIRIHQDLLHRDSSVLLLVEPGSKRVSLTNEGSALIDFDNDGNSDVIVKLDGISAGEASLSFSKVQ